jgi:hypothetical protein
MDLSFGIGIMNGELLIKRPNTLEILMLSPAIQNSQNLSKDQRAPMTDGNE